MTQKRVPSIDHAKARGQKLSEGMPDEVDAVVAGKINSPSSSTRTAADGRYRTILTAPAPGCFDITVGTGIDDTGDEPVSVTDEAVAALVYSEVSATRAMLDSLYSDQAVLGDADVSSLISTVGTLTRATLLALITEQAGGVAGDADVAALVTDDSTATRLALNALYALPPELRSGGPPSVTVDADMGVGATVTLTGTRLVQRVVVTTGASPVQGGILCKLTLAGYDGAPGAFVNARDAGTAAANLFVVTTNSVAAIVAAGELNARTAYTFETMIVGY